MKNSQNYFLRSKIISVDNFFNKVLFDKKKGYYSSKFPFGHKGDFLTAPGLSKLFSEMIGIWLISTWKVLGKPKKINIVELGPGDGSLTKDLIKTFKQFPEFYNAVNFFLYEKSVFLKNSQKKNIGDKNIKWIQNFKNIKKYPVIFFGNEFFDAIPVKQFLRRDGLLYEKYYTLNNFNRITEIYKKVPKKNLYKIKSYRSLHKLNFIEYPKMGFDVLKNMIEKVSQLKGGLFLIDYGYLKPNNIDTLQSIFKHKKNDLLDNLGKADVTSLVNFELLKEHFKKNNLKVKKVVTQSFFLKKMGILERANNLSVKMNFKEQSNLYLRLKRLLDVRLMGELFKVIFAYNSKKDNFHGFK